MEGAFGTGVGRQLILFIDVLIGRPHLTADFNPWGLKAGVGTELGCNEGTRIDEVKPREEGERFSLCTLLGDTREWSAFMEELEN